MIKIKDVKFEKGIRGTDNILKSDISQIAFVGRSNVGKSSVINSLINRKNFVKSSSVPGKTREINFFLINKKVYFVDLPGYGFAKMSKSQSDKLRKLILWYLTSGEAINLKKVVLIIDAKVGPSDLDVQMVEILKERGDFLVLANKIDKLKKNDIKKRIKDIKHKLDVVVYPYSAEKKIGRDDFLKLLFNEQS